MSELKVEVDPAEVGLDPDRLERIGARFARYVDDGQLPGWLVTVNRRGRLATWPGTGPGAWPPTSRSRRTRCGASTR